MRTAPRLIDHLLVLDWPAFIVSVVRYSVSNLAPDSSKLWCAALLLGLCVVALRGFFVGCKWHALVSANSPMTCVF